MEETTSSRTTAEHDARRHLGKRGVTLVMAELRALAVAATGASVITMGTVEDPVSSTCMLS